MTTRGLPEMTDEEADRPVTRGDADRIITSLDRLTAKYRWTLALSVAVAVALVGVCVAVVLGGVALVQVRHESQCVAALAAASADRTGALAPLASARSAAQDAQANADADLVFKAITTAGETAAQRRADTAADVLAFTAAHQTYQSANEAYQQAYAANPPPKATAFHC